MQSSRRHSNRDHIPTESWASNGLFSQHQNEKCCTADRRVVKVSTIGRPLALFSNPNFNGLILRRTNDELRELIWKSRELYPRAYPGAKWQEKKSQWTFPSGAKLWMTFLERDEDCLRYQGLSFSYIAFDELTQHPTPICLELHAITATDHRS